MDIIQQMHAIADSVSSDTLRASCQLKLPHEEPLGHHKWSEFKKSWSSVGDRGNSDLFLARTHVAEDVAFLGHDDAT